MLERLLAKESLTRRRESTEIWLDSISVRFSTRLQPLAQELHQQTRYFAEIAGKISPKDSTQRRLQHLLCPTDGPSPNA